MPIDPPYCGRVAGPMTRTVADAALMMRVLSKPDDRDTMSLPPQDIAWLDLDMRTSAGLRIGLLLDAGARPGGRGRGRGGGRPAAKRFESRRRHRSSRVEPFLTRAMLDGLDHFWRLRAWVDIGALPRRAAGQGPALHPRLGRGRTAGSRGAEVFDGMSQMLAMRDAAVAADAAVRFRALAGRADAGLPGRARLADRRPGAAVRAHRLHGAVQHVRSSRRRRSTAATRRPGCRSACRSSATASTISASCAWRTPSRRCAPRSGPGLCERKNKRRFASCCAGSRIAFHSASLRYRLPGKRG